MSTIAVNHWGSHPDEENDDCWSGEDYATEAEAVAAYKLDAPSNTAYIEIDLSDEDCTRLGIERCRKNPKFIPSRDSGSWQREIANEAGMLGGIHAYNDAMGFDSEEYDGFRFVAITFGLLAISLSAGILVGKCLWGFP